jgi:hypothetical protein
MRFHRIHELREPLVALPERLDARLAVVLARSAAPELREAADHILQPRGYLRRAAVMLHGVDCLPRVRFEPYCTSDLWRGTSHQSDELDTPRHDAGDRPSMQPARLRLQPSWLALAALLEVPEQARHLPAAAGPLPPRTRPGTIPHR